MNQVVLVPNPNTQILNGQSVADSYVPLGLLSVATQLKHEHISVRIVDINNGNMCFDPSKSSKSILDENPDVIGFSTQINEYHRTLQIAELCKKNHPKSVIIFGGPQASVTDVASLNAFPFIDVIVRGECEDRIGILINAIKNNESLNGIPGITFRSGDQIIKTRDAPPIEDLNVIPLPEYTLVPNMEDYKQLPIEVGRGCPFSCTFCSTSDFFQRRFRFRNVNQLLKLIDSLNKEFGVSSFAFQHDNLTVSKKTLRDLCFGIKMSSFNISWSCSARLDYLNKEIIENMAEAGCTEIFVGIETGSPRVQESIGKRLDLDKVVDTVDLLRSCKINYTASFMMGFPVETLDDLEKTISLMTILRFKGNGRERTQLHLVSAYPGTKMYEDYKSKLHYDGYFSDTAVSYLTEDMKILVNRYPEIFSSFQYIVNNSLDRQLLIKINFFFLTLMNYFPYTSLIMSQIPGLDYPRRLMDFCGNMDIPPKTWVLSNNYERIVSGYQLLNKYFDSYSENISYCKEALNYEKTAVDLEFGVIEDQTMIVREFKYDIDGWISKVVDGVIPPMSDLKKEQENHVLFIKESGKVKTMILPQIIGEYISGFSYTQK